MRSVTFSEHLVTTIPPSSATTEEDLTLEDVREVNRGEHDSHEQERHDQGHDQGHESHQRGGQGRRRLRQQYKKPSIWRLVIVGILFTGGIVVGALVWRKTRQDDDSGDDSFRNDDTEGNSVTYADGTFQNPDAVTWKALGNDITLLQQQQQQIQQHNQREQSTESASNNTIHVALSADATTLVTANHTCIQIWKWTSAEEWDAVATLSNTVIYALTLAGDGHRLAVVTTANRIRFYDNIKDGRWSLRPEFLGALPQASLTLNYDGTVFATGFDTKLISLREWNFADATWVPQTIQDDATNFLQETIVQQLHLSADGKALVMAVKDKDGITIVRTYTRTSASDSAGSFVWMPKGQALTSGPHDGAFFGHAVAISSAGNVLAISSPEFQQRGLVKVYEYKGNRWQVRKQPVLGDAANNNNGVTFGKHVCLSANANMLSILDGTMVRFYQADSSAQGWTPVGRPDTSPFERTEPSPTNDNDGEGQPTAPASLSSPIVWDILQCSADGRTLVAASRALQLVRAAQAVEEDHG